jgi:hypothetical protein
MKVKIGNRLFDSENEPIMITLNSGEKGLIQNMGELTTLCIAPERCTSKAINDFMSEKAHAYGWVEVPQMFLYMVIGVLFLILMTIIFN